MHLNKPNAQRYRTKQRACYVQEVGLFRWSPYLPEDNRNSRL